MQYCKLLINSSKKMESLSKFFAYSNNPCVLEQNGINCSTSLEHTKDFVECDEASFNEFPVEKYVIKDKDGEPVKDKDGQPVKDKDGQPVKDKDGQPDKNNEGKSWFEDS